VRLRGHVLVCRGPDCASRGAQDVYTAIAAETERQGLLDDVTQTQSGCVGPVCGRGPVVCCYPTGVWYAPVRPEDAAEIVREDLGAGRAVERLAAARVGVTA
jgi:(2Fe-2S) ferredoxin